jgi:hypothetical protein
VPRCGAEEEEDAAGEADVEGSDMRRVEAQPAARCAAMSAKVMAAGRASQMK